MALQLPQSGAWRRYLPWLLVGLVILLTVAIRFRLRETPLERDEGEYAYAGQLILQGIPPYKLAYNMKLPGTYAAYALIMMVFGQTPSGIHIGLAVVNAICIALMFLVARKVLDDAGAITAALIFALMSITPSVLGLAAHATHFVVACALAAILVLLNICEPKGQADTPQAAEQGPSTAVRRGRLQLFGAGLLFGLAILMKQHGIAFAAAGGIYLVRCRLQQAGEAMPRKSPGRRQRIDRGRRNRFLLSLAGDVGLLALGGILPYLVMCLILTAAGVFHEFWFWTFSYARKYVSSIPMAEGPSYLRQTMGGIFADNPYFWICLCLGAVVMWWDERLTRNTRFFLTLFTFCSIAAVSAGFYFREHYFIMLLPAVALINGVAVSRSLRLLRHDKTIELFLTVPILLLILIGFGNAFVTFGSLWFTLSPTQASSKIYGSSIFSEALKAAQIIRNHTGSEARIAVVGSEPEIYFYARRKSVTGFVYTYPLMEAHDYALKMQEQMIRDIETAKPEYIVHVSYNLSWLAQASSETKIFRWWESYWIPNYNLEQTLNITEDSPNASDASNSGPEPDGKGGSYILVLKRK